MEEKDENEASGKLPVQPSVAGFGRLSGKVVFLALWATGSQAQLLNSDEGTQTQPENMCTSQTWLPTRTLFLKRAGWN